MPTPTLISRLLYRRLQLLVTGRTRYWSTSTHLVCVPLVVQARTCYILKLLLIYGSVSFSSSLRLPCSVHRNLPWGNLSPLPPSCSGLLWRRRLIHSTWRYFAGAVLIWYTVSRLWQHVTENLATQAASVLRLCLRPPFLFCSLAGFHLESTSNSLGATSLWPAGLPKAFKYIYI